jgi:very-short-patch-repair endonuclease
VPGGPEEQMEMLGHQHPSEQAEILLLSKLNESLNKMRAETVGIELTTTAVGAGGDEVQVIQSVVMPLPRHGGILQPGIAHIAKNAMYAPPAVKNENESLPAGPFSGAGALFLLTYARKPAGVRPMENSPTSNGKQSPAANDARPEPIAGTAEEGLDRIRKRLLDLTKRNPLLNYHHPKRSCIRIVNVEMDQVFEDLLGNTAESQTQHKLRFQAVPRSPKDEPPDSAEGKVVHQRDVLEDAKKSGWSTSYDLYDAPGAGELLCALQYRDELDRSIRLMDSKARTIIEESGTNMLYLVFGFLEWCESEDSDESHLAPLLMVPVQLERTRGAHLGTIEYTGDQLESNPSLAERLRHDFSLALPEYEEEKSPGTYFAEFEHILKVKPRWKLRRFLTLAFLSFTKILMYRDLDPARWPDGLLAQHPRVRELFEGTEQTEAEYGQEYMIDTPEMKGRVPKLILDADSSQHSAMIDAVEGKNLVIQGPPGTGKSQTITNLIAHTISSGKTVLFVAEKLAALEVVRKRLDDVGLGIFCLELHNHRTRKQGLMRDLEARLSYFRWRFAGPPETEAKVNLLSEKKERLIQYTQLLNSTWTPLGRTIFEVLWARQRALRELPFPALLLLPIKLSFAANCSREDLERTEQFIAIYVNHLKDITAGRKIVNDHPWAWVANASLSFQDEARMVELVHSILASVEAATQGLSSLAEGTGFQMALTLGSLSEAGRILQSLKSIEMELFPALLAPCLSSEVRKGMSSLIERIEAEAGVRAKGFELSHRLDTEVIKDPATLQTYANTISSAGLWERLFGANYRAANRAYRSISLKKQNRDARAAEFRELAEYHLQLAKYSDAISIDSVASHMAPGVDNKTNAGLKEPLSCWNRFLMSAKTKAQPSADFQALRHELGNRLRVVRNSVKGAKVLESLNLPPAANEWLVCDDFIQRVAELEAKLQSLSEHPLLSQCAEIAKISGATTDPAWTEGSFAEIFDCCTRLAEHDEDLHPWVSYLKLQEQSKTRGVGELCELADSGKIAAEDIVPCFKFAFYNSLSYAAFERHPELSEFSGMTLEEVRNQFSSLDRELMQLQRQQFAALIDSRHVPGGNKSGPVGSWTDLALIRHEVDKQKRHIPIRKLVERAGFALQCLKPCFMMGPLSVAQYITPGKLTFDLVVMDEASQLRPEDAIGAVARGGQLVVVGDPKQLPPTDFFQRLDLEGDEDVSDDDRAVVEEGESILDVAKGVYQPARQLRWHYRSRHESLIAFSNNEFYGGNLIVFPTPFPEREDLGVRYHEIARPVYENRRNVPEAQAVVDAVIDHMRQHDGESLGVVTMNLQQKELIEELYENVLAEDPQAQAYQEKFSAGLESFFIKNLENVQGDERDVIFISCTYGPDARGNQYQRFGPINSENGWRRLNVLFTRAKKRVEVFSSLDPGKILTPPGSHRGARALKGYLEYAKTGILGSANSGSGEPDSDFEVSVAGVLADNGYEVRPQVGVAGFFIDLAVVHPYEPGVYITGIECDGAAYHSARSARDRDRLRQEILQNLGWKIYRIWSTDWFRSRESETKRLISYVNSLVDQDPQVKARRAEQDKLNALRESLIEFRETEIRAAFPDLEPARCLLRDPMINEFVKYRPTSKDEWFRRISHALRSGTDSGQVGRFLDEVLEMIREHVS